MEQQQRSLRFGAAMILCALLFRLFTSGVPERIVSWLTEPNTAAFVTYLETGRNVRFSASNAVFSPQFVESPPPAIPEPTEAALPSFSDAEIIDMYNSCKKNPDVEALLQQPLTWDLRGDEPTVLILHTHSTESYTKNGEDYEETSSWRTLDEDYNMLSIGYRVGEILADNGITAIQDRELHDYPSYNGSYVDARGSIAAYLEEYPTIQLVLDLHRDAIEGSNGRQLATTATINGQRVAQMMLVMGINYDSWEENLALGLKLQAQLETQAPGIMRSVNLRAQRFNQDLCPGALLVEMGAAGNTHAEAMLAAEELAAAIVALARGTE